MEIRIDVGRQIDGFTFSLDPKVKDIIRPLTKVNLASSLFIAYDTKADFEYFYGSDMLLSQSNLGRTDTMH